MKTVTLIWSDNYRERPVQTVPAITDYFPSVVVAKDNAGAQASDIMPSVPDALHSKLRGAYLKTVIRGTSIMENQIEQW